MHHKTLVASLMSLFVLASAFGVAISFAAVNACADTVISDLSQTPVGVDGVVLNAAAQAFTTGGTPGTLDDVVLELLGTGGAVGVSLFSDNSGLPGSSLLSLGTLTPTGSGFAPHTAAGSFALAAHTTYWVVVDYLGAPSWGFTDSSSFTGTGTLGSFTSSVDGGATWEGPFTPQESGFEPYLLEVGAAAPTAAPTATPEPSSLLLLGTGLLGALSVKRRKLLC